MNINEISVYENRKQDAGKAVAGGSPFLDAVKRGKALTQQVSGITDRFTQSGEGAGAGIMNGYGTVEKDKGNTDVSRAQQKANEDLAVLTGEDCEALEEDGDSLVENTREYVENAVRKNKERKAYNERNQEKSLELRARMREEREEREALGFAELKSEAELRGALEEAGLAVTPENLSRLSGALAMSEEALELTDQSKAYVIGNHLEPTVENLYQGKYLAVSAKAPKNQDFEAYQGQIQKILEDNGFDTEKDLKYAKWLFGHELPVNPDTLETLSGLERIAGEMTPARVLTQLLFTMSVGKDPKEALLDDQAFLSAQRFTGQLEEITDGDIVLVSEYLEEQENSSKEGGNTGSVLNDGAQGVSFVKEKKNGIVVNLELFQRVREERGEHTKRNTAETGRAEQPVLQVTGQPVLQAKEQIILKRQLEEIRQKMTMEAAVSMIRKGIKVETEPLEQVINELRRMENTFVEKQLGVRTDVLQGADAVTDGEFELLQETLGKTRDIAEGFAGVLGGSVRKHLLLTVNELHAAVGSEHFSRREWAGVYETVQTQVRADLGDSMKKAFESIPSLLESMGLEDTEANERAVRILGYNRMEITEESIGEVKVFDAKVNQMLSGMKPVTVLELIRRGENPLETPLDELNEKLKTINEEKNVTGEERYSKFLWMLEKDGQISEEERSGYIGIYRLLHQIEKSDGAAIGALIGSGREMTLGNLLTQVRTKKSGGVNLSVDDVSGVKQAVHTGGSITEQIEKGFSGNAEENSSSMQEGSAQERDMAEQMTAYYETLIEDAAKEILPSKLREMTDGDLKKLLGYSVEHFAEALKKTGGNQEIKKAYYEALAEDIRNGLKHTEAAEELLAKLSIPETVDHLLAAKETLDGQENIYGEIYRRRRILDKQAEEALEEVIDELPETVDSPEELERSCEQAEKIMEEVLAKSYESADITFEDLQKLRQLGRGIRLRAAFRESERYEIPIRTGDSVTSLNLTIVRSADETGRVQISMDDGTFGRLSLDFRVKNVLEVKGLVLCSERQGFEALRGEQEELKIEIENAGFSVKNISYGMDFKLGNEWAGKQEDGADADTGGLYRLAKLLVRHVMLQGKKQDTGSI